MKSSLSLAIIALLSQNSQQIKIAGEPLSFAEKQSALDDIDDLIKPVTQKEIEEINKQNTVTQGLLEDFSKRQAFKQQSSIPNLPSKTQGSKSISSKDVIIKAQQNAEIARKQAEFINKEQSRAPSSNNEDTEESKQEQRMAQKIKENKEKRSKPKSQGQKLDEKDNQKKLVENMDIDQENKNEIDAIRNNEYKKEIDKLYHASDIIDVPAPSPKDLEGQTEKISDALDVFKKNPQPLYGGAELGKNGSTFIDSTNHSQTNTNLKHDPQNKGKKWFVPDSDYVPAEKAFIKLTPSLSKVEKLAQSTRNIMGHSKWGTHINNAIHKNGFPDTDKNLEYYHEFFSKACVLAKFDEVLDNQGFKASKELSEECNSGQWLELINKDPELKPLHWLYSMNEDKGLEKGFKGSYWWFQHPAKEKGYLDEQRLREPNFENSVTSLTFHDRDYAAKIPSGIPFQNFGETFPRHQFSAMFTGYIRLMQAGEYEFRATSGDGSNIYLDGEKILNNYGLHPMDKYTEEQYWSSFKDTKAKNLKQGWYPLWVDYFNNTGPNELRVQMKGPDTKFEWKDVVGYHFPEEKYKEIKEKDNLATL